MNDTMRPKGLYGLYELIICLTRNRMRIFNLCKCLAWNVLHEKHTGRYGAAFPVAGNNPTRSIEQGNDRSLKVGKASVPFNFVSE